MLTPNLHYAELKDSYLFARIAEKTAKYCEDHPGAHLLRMGIGDVSRPLCPAVIAAMHDAVEDQARISAGVRRAVSAADHCGILSEAGCRPRGG